MNSQVVRFVTRADGIPRQEDVPHVPHACQVPVIGRDGIHKRERDSRAVLTRPLEVFRAPSGKTVRHGSAEGVLRRAARAVRIGKETRVVRAFQDEELDIRPRGHADILRDLIGRLQAQAGRPSGQGDSPFDDPSERDSHGQRHNDRPDGSGRTPH